MTIRRVAVSTGGGDCPGLNAVIRGLVKTGVMAYNWEFLGIEDGLTGLIMPNKLTDLTLASVRGILPRGGTILGTTNKGNPFRYPVKKDGEIVEEDISDRIVERLNKLRVDCLALVGGDGTMAIAHKLAQKGINIVGIPKTIDNDLDATDYTFGFDTAVNIAMEALDRLHTTAESHDRVMILEVMGRHAGHIALTAGLAGGADIILTPEIPYRVDAVLKKLHRRYRAGSTFSIIVVAEGAKPRDGEVSILEGGGVGSVQRLGGAGERLAQQIAQRSPEIDIRVTVLGHLQRGGSPSCFDRVLGSRFGVAAAHLIHQGKFDHMVCLKGLDIQHVPIEEAISTMRGVDISSGGGPVAAARSLGITLGDEAVTATTELAAVYLDNGK